MPPIRIFQCVAGHLICEVFIIYVSETLFSLHLMVHDPSKNVMWIWDAVKWEIGTYPTYNKKLNNCYLISGTTSC